MHPLQPAHDSVLIELSDQPLQLDQAHAFVQDEQAGGIDIFIGTTRGDIDASMGLLEALDYSAYPEMAIRQIRAIVTNARAEWPICRAAVLHRTGVVPLGHPSVIVAVSSPHRDQAFSACRFIIDELKRAAPIWKKDIYSTGQRWQGEDDQSPPDSPATPAH